MPLVTVVTDVLSVVFQVIGCGAEAEAVGERIASEVDDEGLTGLRQIIKDIEDAKSIPEKAKAFQSLFSEVHKLLGIKKIISAIEQHLEWYDLLIMGVTITAQFALWFLSDGAALIGELVLLGAMLAKAGTDAASACKACSWI